MAVLNSTSSPGASAGRMYDGHDLCTSLHVSLPAYAGGGVSVLCVCIYILYICVCVSAAV